MLGIESWREGGGGLGLKGEGLEEGGIGLSINMLHNTYTALLLRLPEFRH